MGSGASSSASAPTGESAGTADAPMSRADKLRAALKEGDDMSDYSISEIAKCKLAEPPVTPCSQSKAQLLECVDFEQSTIVRQVPALIKQSSKDLVTSLTQGLHDDLSKLRAIYLFITSIDIGQLQQDDSAKVVVNSPLEYLLYIKQQKGNHAHLFCALCKIGGIPCELVTGYTKSAAYQLGKAVDAKKMAAQWNAVYVCGEWRLVDCFWASVCLVGGDDEADWEVLDIDGRTTAGLAVSASDELTHRVNDFFFITDPDKLIVTHLPKEDKWQLLTKAQVISRQQFEKAAYRRERFYELGMKTARDELSRCVLCADKGTLTVTLEISEDSPSLDFKYIMLKAKANEDMSAQFNRYVLFQRNSGSICYDIALPIKGQFKLDIYGKDSRKHNSMDLVSSYLINCTKGVIDQEPLPDNPNIGWGPHGGYLEAYGIEPVSHKHSIIETDTGLVDIVFSTQVSLELKLAMLSNSHSEKVMSDYAYIEVAKSDFIIHIRLPQAGLYACKLFTNEEGIPAPVQNVCNYVIKCTKAVTNSPLPFIPNGKTGACSLLTRLGIEVIEPIQSGVMVKDGKVKVVLKVPDGVLIHPCIHHSVQPASSTKEISAVKDKDVVTIELNLTAKGLHCLAIYASVEGKPHQLYSVYNYMIDYSAQSVSKTAAVNSPHTVNCTGGKVEITSPGEAQLMVFLVKEGECAGMEDNHVTVRQDAEQSTASVQLPEEGKYLLQLYHGDTDGTIQHRGSYEVKHTDIDAEATEQEPALASIEEEEEEEEEIVEEAPVAEETEEERIEREQRDNLNKAIKTDKEDTLQAAIDDFLKLDNLSDGGKSLLAKAQRIVKAFRFGKELRVVMKEEDMAALEKKIEQGHAMQHHGKLKKALHAAEQILQKLKRLEKLRQSVLILDQRTIAEIKSFATPPKPVETTMRATLMMLGTPQSELKEWKMIVAYIGKTGKESLKRKVMAFELMEMTEEVVADALRMLNTFNSIDVRDASSGAAVFYLWANGMIEAYNNKVAQKQE